jgi:hypothetical protein
MPEELAVFRQSPEWHGTGNREARLTAVFQYQRWYAGFEQLNTQVPINECVYSIKPAIVGLLAKRSSFHTPLPNTRLGEKLEPEDAKCRYVHMVAFSSPTYSEPFYPLSRWINEITVLNTTHYIANDDRSTVVSLIAKTR